MPNHCLRLKNRGFMVVLEGCGPKWAFLCAFFLAVSGCGKARNAGVNPHDSTDVVADRGIEQRVEGEPVSATLRLSRTRAMIGDSIEVTVTLDIAPMWEIRTLDAQPASAATRFELKLPDGLNSLGEWRAPVPARSITADGHPAYAGEAVFTRTVVVSEGAAVGENSVQCRVTYQACDERRCLQPAAVELNVPVRIEK